MAWHGAIGGIISASNGISMKNNENKQHHRVISKYQRRKRKQHRVIKSRLLSSEGQCVVILMKAYLLLYWPAITFLHPDINVYSMTLQPVNDDRQCLPMLTVMQWPAFEMTYCLANLPILILQYLIYSIVWPILMTKYWYSSNRYKMWLITVSHYSRYSYYHSAIPIIYRAARNENRQIMKAKAKKAKKENEKRK